MASTDARAVAAVRQFNRFYTRQMGVLHEHLLASSFSLTEVRVLYELATRENATAAALVEELGVDPGYLSRMLRDFEERRLVTRRRSPDDGRRALLTLTAKGRRTFAPLDARSDEEVRVLLGRLEEPERRRLIEAMSTITTLLGERAPGREPFVLRPHRPGDIGWVISRHGELYALEYGWNEEFEALVAEIAAKFVREFDAKRERCWIAERDGERIGCVFVVKESEKVAKLRLLLVDPKARGLGLGKKLVDEVIAFARYSGYEKVVLWTNNVLLAARHIYEAAGFRMVEQQPHHSWGCDQVGESWELLL